MPRGLTTFTGVLVFLLAAGCRPTDRRAEQGKPTATIPAGSVQFHLVAPGKERRSGLYAVRLLVGGMKANFQSLFSSAADGKAAEPMAGQRLMMVGKLPGTVQGEDFFKPGAGTIRGGRIEVPAKFVRYVDQISASQTCAVYFTVSLPGLPAGKYRATVTFRDYEYTRDRKKVTPSKKELPRFKPLVCEFEVRAAAKVKVSWGKAVNGLRIGLMRKDYQFLEGRPIDLAAQLQNLGNADLVLYDAGHSLPWRFRFVPSGGGQPLIGHWDPGKKEDRLAPVNVSLPKRAIVPTTFQVWTQYVYDTTGQGSALDGDPSVLSFPPPGRYTVTASYGHLEHPTREPCPYWHGKLTTGAVEIEIKPKAKVKK